MVAGKNKTELQNLQHKHKRETCVNVADFVTPF